ncbi:MAG: hypothetical protein Q8Q41_01705, partial [bacterium]|nr:hypothetical protein [bacterium]
MLFTSHAIVGAAVGVAAGNPYYGFLGGIASHHVLDAIPHFDQGTFRIKKEGARYLGKTAEYSERHFAASDWAILFADWAVSVLIFNALVWFLPLEYFLPMFAGALGGLLPDIVDSSPLWSKKLRAKSRVLAAYHKFHAFFHWTVAWSRLWLGLGTQVLAVAVAMAYLL